MSLTKKQIRETIAARRKALDFQWLETASAQVMRNLQTLEAFRTSETIALYMAIAGEVILDDLFSSCWKQGKRTCIPVFNRELNVYEISEITEETRFKTGHFGIREPVCPVRVSRDWIDLMAVPGVAFDLAGRRLGRGGGYYDRLLDGFGGKTAAVAFDFQIVLQIPTEPHDRPVDAIVTETKTVEVQNER